MIKLNNYELIDEIKGADGDKNVVILEEMDSNEDKIKEILNKWIGIIKPKYILDYISPADLMDFRMRKEREWDEEDNKFMLNTHEIKGKY